MPSIPVAGFIAAELPKDILAGIGAIVAQWSYLAFQLTVIVRLAHKMTKESQRALLVGAEVGVLCAHLRTIANTDHWIKSKTLREEIKSLAKDVQDASDARNAYAHGLFGYFLNDLPTDSGQEIYFRFLMKSAEHRISPGTEEISLDSLNAHSETALDLWKRAQSITDRLKGKSGK